jgi:hypothetical protein
VVLPGHGQPFADCERRIEVILRNKRRRLKAIQDLIAKRPHTVVEIADQVFARDLPNWQRSFALSETLAHIAYLRSEGVVERRTRSDGVYEWYRKSTGTESVW